jgi:hypothetical protein
MLSRPEQVEIPRRTFSLTVSAYEVACSRPYDSHAIYNYCLDCRAAHSTSENGSTGRASAPNGSQSRGGLEARGDIAMSRKTDAVVARTIGTNTLHLIGPG